MIRGLLNKKETEETDLELITEDEYLDVLDKLPKENQ